MNLCDNSTTLYDWIVQFYVIELYIEDSEGNKDAERTAFGSQSLAERFARDIIFNNRV